ncbi:IS110 family RNA-guided transposase [Niabella ginsenosidivorans]|nr:IS110 family transposase [Niabella ginsenosidivorans]
MSNLVSFEQHNACAAAIDIGSKRIFVSCDGITVKSYDTFTFSYRKCIEDLRSQQVKTVCMEATGVYWIALHELLEQAGFCVCLVNPKEVKQVKGRKTDVADACWMQKMFSAGLVRQSYIPAGRLKELRMLMREREDIISMGSSYVNKMQKALELMNIKLTEVISQITGVSGIRMIEAILRGERDGKVLLSLCHKSIKDKKADEVLMALEGNYNESWLFLLEQNLKLWKIHEQQILIVDQRMEVLLSFLEQGSSFVAPVHKEKPVRHHKPMIKDLNQKLLNIYGVDAGCLPGVTNYSMLKLLGETGTDLSRFPTEKHYVSWCGLSPGHNQSGSRSRKAKMKNSSRVGQIFREIAQSLLNSKPIAIGTFIRRIRTRKGPAIAIKAGARKIAIAFYNLLTKGTAYLEQGAAKYEQQLKQREQQYLLKLATKHNLKLVEI